MWLVIENGMGQGLLVDQASGTLAETIVNGSVIPQNDLAQSFTRSLSAVAFVQLRTLITLPSGGTVTLVVNLRDGAYNGPIISSTTAVDIIGFADIGTFYFPDNIPVTPGQLYFFQPVLQSNGSLSIGTKSPSPYTNGDLWTNGLRDPNADLWFREGVVVPEPGAVWLFVLGCIAFLWRWRVGTRS
ncbi:MAG: hypothetical protein DME19_14385 [Verrucomicrobia bacterium]|nr:MAG: hypothetical protein DME19_14385 [Verrucomicrobiota bacterium]